MIGTESVRAASIAGFRLDRISGVGVAALDLNGSVAPLLAQNAVTEADLATATEPLIAAIFDLVPRLDRLDRRTVLALKRRIHRGQQIDPEDCDALIAAGVPDLELKTWVHACEERALGLQRLDIAVEAAGDVTASRLRELIGTPALALTLPVVAPDFIDRIADADLRPGARASRTALLYLVRAALKPSPLRHLTTVALYPIGSREQQDVAVPIGLVHGLFSALAGTPRFTDAFDYRPAYQVPAQGPSVILRSNRSDHGSLWSQERIADAAQYAAELAHLVAAGAELSTVLSAERLSRLVRMGLLVPVVPWAAGAADALPVLADVLDRSAAPDAPPMAGLLRDFQQAVIELGSAGPGDRAELIPQLHTRANALADVCGAPRWTDTLLHEDVAVRDSAGELPDVVGDDLRDFAGQVRPYLFRTHLYDLILDAFRSTFGAGGRCGDAVGFFLRLYADAAFVRQIRAARAADLALDVPPSGRAWLPVGRTSAPPAVAVMYQLAATSSAALTGGDYRLVVNQLGSALGGLVTRFGRVFQDGAVTRSVLPWLEQLYPFCEIRSFTLSAAVNNLQHAGAGHLPEITWPTEFQHLSAGALKFDELGLRHDPTTDTLEFVSRDGRDIAPVYTGIVPGSLCNGPAQLALAVMDPWVDGSPMSRANHPFLRSRGGDAERVISTPRQGSGRVVSQRARWLVPVADFPLPLPAETAGRYLARLDNWRRSIDLPAEAFFLAIASDPFDANRRKPMWIDFASSHSVHTALPLIVGSRAIRFEEPLPARTEAWVPGIDGPRMCEHISFLGWRRPDGSKSASEWRQP